MMTDHGSPHEQIPRIEVVEGGVSRIEKTTSKKSQVTYSTAENENLYILYIVYQTAEMRFSVKSTVCEVETWTSFSETLPMR